MKAFKGFNKDMTCRGFQYDEGKEYESAVAKVCQGGFHACEYPLNCFEYYNPAQSVYHEVEQDGVIDKAECKTASTKIKIGKRLSITDLIDAAIDAISAKITARCTGNVHNSALITTDDHTKSLATGCWSASVTTGAFAESIVEGDRGVSVATGRYNAAINKGFHGAAVATEEYSVSRTPHNCNASIVTHDHSASVAEGYRSVSSAIGDWSAASATGQESASVTTGLRSASSTMGNRGVAASIGFCGTSNAMNTRGVAVATGDYSKSSATSEWGASVNTGDYTESSAAGNYSISAVTGDCSESVVSGKFSVSVAIGEGSGSSQTKDPNSLAVAWCGEAYAMGVKGSYILLSDWDYKTSEPVLEGVKLIHIDGKRYKENTWYTYYDGKVVEAEEV